MLRLPGCVAAAVLVVMLAAVIPASVRAVGLGVTPGRMDFTVRPGGTEVQTLRVINQSNGPSRFEVYVEGQHAEWFTVTPGEFILDAGEIIGVEIAVTPPVTVRPQSCELSICVLTLPPDSELRLGAGVKVPAHVQVAFGTPIMAVQWWIVSAAIVLAAAIVTAMLLRRKGRSSGGPIVLGQAHD